MSFEYYSKWWAASRKRLEDLVERDEQFRKKTKSIKDRTLAGQLIGGLYAKYSLIVQEIGTVLDQMVQPQKRITVRKLMDAATIRLHELNEELRKIDISEYHYIDGTLVELKLIPSEVEILDPILYYLRHYGLENMWTKIKAGEKIYIPPPPPPEPDPGPASGAEGDGVAAPSSGEAKPEETPPPPSEAEKEKKASKRPKKFVLETKELSPEELADVQRKEGLKNSVILIQNAERGRQARLYYFEKSASLRRQKAMTSGLKTDTPVEVTAEEKTFAANQIQRLWAGHSAREMVKRKERQRRLLIGMTEPSWKSKEQFEILERNLQKRRDLRDLRIREYIEAHLSERERVFRVFGPRLFEDIGDEIREWFWVWYTTVRNFDKYPPEEKGGTILVIRGETMTPQEWLDDVEKKRKEKERNKGKDKAKEKEKLEKEKQKKKEAEKKKKEAEKKKREAEKKKKKKRKGNEFELELEDSETKKYFDGGFDEYKEIWDQRDDMENPLEKHYMDMINEEKCHMMQMEIRVQVDELMRIELDLLNNALEEDRIKMKGGKRKKKKNKPKKAKKKKKKKKGKKDPTGNRSTEDLFQELADNGIIHSYNKALLRDYFGDFSYKNWELRNLEFDPPATLGDVRQAVKINCILPISTEAMKKPRSVLLIGPRQSGKHLLANAVFTESQCVLFDLSPEVLAGKYPGKKGMKMLLHLINKMARLLQPSIIYFDGAEKIFYKKVPKEEKKLEPKRIGKKLLKGIVKTIKPEDRVLVFGITGKPFLAQQKKLIKTFERIILIPRPDYGSIYLYWRHLLMPYHGVDRDFSVSSLATLTTNFTLPSIKQAVDQVMTPKRIVELNRKPLTATELYEPLIDVEPITDKEYNKLLKFYNKTTLGKERVIFNKFAEIKREAEAKKMEKQKAKK